MWALLQTIDSMIEMIYLGSLPLNYIPRWLLHKDTLSKIVVEEGIGPVKLMKRLPLIHRQRENNMYQVKAYHMGEGFFVFNLIGLGEPTSNYISFVSMNCPIMIVLKFKHQSACNNVSVGTSRY